MKKEFNLYENFSYAIEKFDLSDKVAVAVSGGADSMALALLINQFAQDKGIKIVALTVDHGLRLESADEALLVKNWLENKKIEHHTLHWLGNKKSSNIQAEARDARYKLMTGFCKKNSIKTLLVAHNLEDQAETVLLRLMRGSGVDGISGMQNDIDFEGLKILRPLLEIPKRYLREFLREQGQQWVEDPSNKNPKYARVAVRQFIENSLEPGLLACRLATTAKNMQRSRSYIETMVAKDFQLVAEMKPEGYALLTRDKFLNLHEESAYRILAKLIKTVGGDYYKPRFEKIENLYTQIKNQESLSGLTLGGCRISAKKNSIIIARELSAIEPDVDITLDCEVVWDNRFKCNFSGEATQIKLGALTQKGLNQIVEKMENFQSIKIPKKIIYSLPALKSLEKVLAVPHIGYYADEKLKEQFSVIFLY